MDHIKLNVLVVAFLKEIVPLKLEKKIFFFCFCFVLGVDE